MVFNREIKLVDGNDVYVCGNVIGPNAKPTRLGFYWYFLRWLSYVGMVLTGLVGVLSLGFINWSIELRTIRWFLDYAEGAGLPNGEKEIKQ